MGAGDRYMQPKFSVGMPGADVDWPLGKETLVKTNAECGECGAPFGITKAGAYAPHMDKRDDGRPKRRVCFGKVVAR